jgi:hypothetical protein
MTEPTRRMARAADIELKRRGAVSPDEQLRSAEPDGFKYADRDTAAEAWLQPTLDGSVELPREPEPATPAEREQRALEVLGLTLDYDQSELPSQVTSRCHQPPGAWSRGRDCRLAPVALALVW